MEHAYGIGTSNRYGAFLVDDAEDILDQQPAPIDPKVTKEKKKKKPSGSNQNKQLNEKNIQKPVETDTRSNRRDDLKDKPERFGKEADVPPRRGGRGRGGRGNRRGGRSYQDRENRENEEPSTFNNNEGMTTEIKNERSFSERPRGFGQQSRGEFGERRGRGGRGRGGRGRGSSNGGRDYRGKREFDRHSGSDKSSIKPHEKREGNGPHNWGSVRDEVSELDTSNVTDDSQAEEHENTNVQKDGEKPDEETTVEGVEETAHEMTLEEYKAQINQNRYKKDFKIRKAGEGENAEQWKKTYKLDSRKIAATTDNMDYEREEEHGHQGRPSQKHLLDIDISFNEPSGRGGRGGRGGGRGGRGGRGGGRGREGGRGRRGGFGGGRGGNAGGGGSGGGGGGRYRNDGPVAPRVDNEDEFPSLGGSN